MLPEPLPLDNPTLVLILNALIIVLTWLFKQADLVPDGPWGLRIAMLLACGAGAVYTLFEFPVSAWSLNNALLIVGFFTLTSQSIYHLLLKGLFGQVLHDKL